MFDIGQHDFRQSPQPCDQACVIERVIFWCAFQSIESPHRDDFGEAGTGLVYTYSLPLFDVVGHEPR